MMDAGSANLRAASAARNPIDLISGISSNLLCRLERLLRGRR